MKAIVSLSGGMDSATVLAVVLESGLSVEAVSFSYGSKHGGWENRAAAAIAKHYQVGHRLIDLSAIMTHFKSDLLKSGGPIPEGHYEEKSMEKTVVPARNIVFASILTGVAWSTGAGSVWLGIHAGDHAIYPDCRPTFFEAMRDAIREGSDRRIELYAPFLDVTKIEILRKGLSLGVPYNLTRTCYKDQPVACGRCGACRERLEAFQTIKQKDFVEYE